MKKVALCKADNMTKAVNRDIEKVKTLQFGQKWELINDSEVINIKEK
jgi:hypothetical protein